MCTAHFFWACCGLVMGPCRRWYCEGDVTFVSSFCVFLRDWRWSRIEPKNFAYEIVAWKQAFFSMKPVAKPYLRTAVWIVMFYPVCCVLLLALSLPCALPKCLSPTLFNAVVDIFILYIILLYIISLLISFLLFESKWHFAFLLLSVYLSFF